ncbi:MAG: hypothetical protein ABFD81_08290 [Syntrophaceae bacterium]
MLKRSIFFCVLVLLSLGQAREARASNVASVVIYVIFESSLAAGTDRATEMSYYTVDLLDSEDDQSKLFVAIHYIPSGSKERTRSITAMLDKDTPEEDRLTLRLASVAARLDDEISLSTTAHDVIRKLPESKSTFHAKISYKTGSPSRPQEMSDTYLLTYTLTDSF